MSRRPNGRAIKKHRSYTVDEAARALKASKGTVRRWVKNGLPALTDQRPALIMGSELIAFLDGRKKKSQPCQLHQAFCFSCHAPRDPAFADVEVRPLTTTGGMMRALCGRCATVMHKRLSLARMPELRALVTVSIVQGDERIGESRSPCPNDHLETMR
ncbi:helix-turn-helix domain-containing protein [Mangrovicella endophytica]|uniref:helix-turn-helix domain-containing protein n=1 Tax=Mangrovicella endophytica TaxID=2066697 RepID=UPI0013000304|nr:helix-turn-helix domain-containing protein [Mangrovicella endophytica]